MGEQEESAGGVIAFLHPSGFRHHFLRPDLPPPFPFHLLTPTSPLAVRFCFPVALVCVGLLAGSVNRFWNRGFDPHPCARARFALGRSPSGS